MLYCPRKLTSSSSGRGEYSGRQSRSFIGARRLAQTLAVCMRSSKLAPRQPSSFGVLAGLGAWGSVAPSGFRGSSKSDSCQLRVGIPEGQVHGGSGRKVCRFVSPGAARVPGRASARNGAKFKSTGIPQLTMGSTRTPVSSAAAKPGELSGGAG